MIQRIKKNDLLFSRFNLYDYLSDGHRGESIDVFLQDFWQEKIISFTEALALNTSIKILELSLSHMEDKDAIFLANALERSK